MATTKGRGGGVSHQDPVRAAWGGVHVRDERLADACSRFERAGVESIAAAEDTLSATTDAEYRAGFRRQNAARPDLLLFGDATLMFADATTNTIAGAIRTTWGIDEGPQALGFERLLKKLRRGEGEGRSPDLGSQIDRLHAVYVAVNVPRHVLAVHPPANQSVEEFRFDRRSPDTMRIGAWNRPVYEDDEALAVLHARIATDATIPTSHSLGELVVMWALDHSDDLSMETREALESYVRRHGCSVSPKNVTAMTRDLVRDVTDLFGWPLERVVSPHLELLLPK
jgi:hypothetical protein